MQLLKVLVFGIIFFLAVPAYSATVLVIRFHNDSQYPDLDWVGESVVETLMTEFSAADEIVLDRASRSEGMRRLSLRSGALFTKATLIKLGQTLDVDYLCYGTYNATLPPGNTQLRSSSIQISARFIDLRKMQDSPELLEAGPLTDLSRLEEHLAWGSLKYLQPRANFALERFMLPQKLTRADAEESYIRGLLSPHREQQEKWFTQAVALDPHFAAPAFELGKLAMEGKEYRQAIQWFERLSPTDPSYLEGRFKMGLSAYRDGEYSASATYFREVLRAMPLNEVYNNLAGAESYVSVPSAIDDFRRALDGDPNDPVYAFNLALALVKNGSFDEAVKRLRDLTDRDPDDADARTLLEQAESRETASSEGASLPSPRLKDNFDETAYRELKAALQAKAPQ